MVNAKYFVDSFDTSLYNIVITGNHLLQKNLVFSHMVTIPGTVVKWRFHDVVIIHMTILPCG
jgi:hypothetical protein